MAADEYGVGLVHERGRLVVVEESHRCLNFLCTDSAKRRARSSINLIKSKPQPIDEVDESAELYM